MNERKERPILFSAPMVRAILEGRKTQTRRIAKDFTNRDDLDAVLQRFPNQAGGPYGAPGDRLWVKEAWAQRLDLDHLNGTQLFAAGVRNAWYWADGPSKCCHTGCAGAAGRVRSSRFMPRWASRITLELTGVHIERLGDITEAGARAEGIFEERNGWVSDKGQPVSATAVRAYEDLWHSINGSWWPETWVWVLEFKRASA